MACCLVGSKPLSEPMLEYCKLDSYEQFAVKSYSNSEVFIQETVFENVCPFCLSLYVSDVNIIIPDIGISIWKISML